MRTVGSLCDTGLIMLQRYERTVGSLCDAGLCNSAMSEMWVISWIIIFTSVGQLPVKQIRLLVFRKVTKES